jgi:3'-phosphoadenosine 5'-phosphosulfate sulfotransferase (PAPS reductase)/FAD synthetase
MIEKEARLYATMPEYKVLLSKTKAFIKRALAKSINPYIACSFGKDSSVMLHLVLQECKDIPVVFAYAEETFIIDSYSTVIDWWLLNFNINLHKIYCERESILDRTFSSQKIKDFGEYSFVGIREDESKARRMSLKYHGTFHRDKKDKVRISPISNWTSKDIEAYTITNDLPLLETYKYFGFDARTTSAIPSIGRERMLQQLRIRDINAFNQILQLMPDARKFI